MSVINNNGKNDDSINLRSDNNGNDEIWTNKNSNMIIIAKKSQKIPYIHSPAHPSGDHNHLCTDVTIPFYLLAVV